MLFKKISMIMMTVVVATGLSCSPAKEQKQEPAKEEQAVQLATANLIKAMLKPNEEELNKLASDKLSYGHSSGKVETKEDFVQTLVSGKSVFEEINITDERIDVVNQTAIVRHILQAKTNDPGKGPGNIKLGIILTWVKNQNDWQLLARQAFKLPD